MSRLGIRSRTLLYLAVCEEPRPFVVASDQIRWLLAQPPQSSDLSPTPIDIHFPLCGTVQSLLKMLSRSSRWLANCPMPYLFLVFLLLVQLVLADPENFEEPQPKRGNNALLSRYGRALLSRYGKRSVNPPPYVPEDHLAGSFDEGGFLCGALN